MGHQRARHLLEIYVAPSCAGCTIARQRASELQALALPNVEIRLVDLSDSGARRPWQVFAVPTYLLDGQVLSLGNPEQDWFLRKLWAASREPPSAFRRR